MLILQLRELEASGLVRREAHQQVPPKVEYSLTEFGHSLLSALTPLGQWGEDHLERLESLRESSLSAVGEEVRGGLE